MAYNEKLAARIREHLAPHKKVEEKNMMGGLTFMLNGKMCVGIVKDELMIRIDQALHEAVLEMRGCRIMDFTNRPMKGFYFISEEGYQSKKDFERWMAMAVSFNAQAKPAKKKKKKVG